MDLAQFSKSEHLAYSCFLCGTCRNVCPEQIDGAELALQMRRDMVKREESPLHEAAYKRILWEKNPYKFDNYRKSYKKSVLFPGCTFPSIYPRTMKHLENLMEKHNVGVVHECCGKPVYELGLGLEDVESLKRAELKLKSQGVEEVVVICPNCYHFMKGKLDLSIVTIYEKLKELEEGSAVKMDEIPVYLPCPDRAGEEMIKDIRYFLEGNIVYPFTELQCCGLGGCARIKEPDLSSQMGAMEGSGRMYTYCASCISNFKRKGVKEAYHILPLILGVDETAMSGIGAFLNRVKKKIV